MNLYDDGYEAGLSTYKATRENGRYVAPSMILTGPFDAESWDSWHLGYERGWAMGGMLHRNERIAS